MVQFLEQSDSGSHTDVIRDVVVLEDRVRGTVRRVAREQLAERWRTVEVDGVVKNVAKWIRGTDRRFTAVDAEGTPLATFQRR